MYTYIYIRIYVCVCVCVCVRVCVLDAGYSSLCCFLYVLSVVVVSWCVLRMCDFAVCHSMIGRLVMLITR